MITYSLGLCTKCNDGQLKYIVKKMPSGWYCHECNKERLDEGKEKKVYSIPKESKKRGKENREYLKENKKFLKLNTTCGANVIDQHGKLICTFRATEVHHMAGRIGKMLLEKTYWLPCCNVCHRWIELNPIEAKKRGYSLSRLESKQEIIPIEE